MIVLAKLVSLVHSSHVAVVLVDCFRARHTLVSSFCLLLAWAKVVGSSHGVIIVLEHEFFQSQVNEW